MLRCWLQIINYHLFNWTPLTYLDDAFCVLDVLSILILLSIPILFLRILYVTVISIVHDKLFGPYNKWTKIFLLSFCVIRWRKFCFYLKKFSFTFVNYSYLKNALHYCQFARSGTFACYGDMTVTMDKINSKTDGPIDGKKGDERGSTNGISILRFLLFSLQPI